MTFFLLSICFVVGIASLSCCCCEYFSDSFTRADSTNLGADWTETSGDWSIDTNRLATTDTNAIATATATNPDGVEPVYLSVTGRTTVAAEQFYLFTNNGSVYIRITYNSGIGTNDGLAKLVTTTGTKSATYNVDAGGNVSLTLCIVSSGGNYYAVGTYGGTKLSMKTAFTSTLSGVGTGTMSGGTAYFDDYSAGHTAADVTGCSECARNAFSCTCMDQGPPSQFLLNYTDVNQCTCQNSNPIANPGGCSPAVDSSCYDETGAYYLDDVGSCCWEGDSGLSSTFCDDTEAGTTPPVSYCGCTKPGASIGTCPVTTAWRFCINGDGSGTLSGFSGAAWSDLATLTQAGDTCDSWSGTTADGNTISITRV